MSLGGASQKQALQLIPAPFWAPNRNVSTCTLSGRRRYTVSQSVLSSMLAWQPRLSVPDMQFSHVALQINRPMVVAGVSLGGAVALDFAVSHPEAVVKLVLVDAQVPLTPQW